jgi:beta-glucosidase
MVLLKNAGALPVPATAKAIALLGNSSYDLITGGTGSGDVHEAYTVSLVDGLKAEGLGVDPTIAAAYKTYLEQEKAKETRPASMFFTPPRPAEMPVASAELARLAQVSNLAIVTVGRNAGEARDRTIAGDFELTTVEKTLINDVAAAFHGQGKKAIVVLNIGGVIEMASWRDVPDAILLAWQPGQEAGHAIVDVLTGNVAPSGKLATTFPMTYSDVPAAATFPGKTLLGPDPDAHPGPFARSDRDAEIAYEDEVFVGYRHYATKKVKPAYPFGFGLSYTTFAYADLALSDREVRSELTASVRVTNTGRTAGREVVQLYLSAPGTSMPKPAIELKAFAKTKTLAPGESQTLTFRLTPRDLESFDEASSSWRAEAGTYTVRIGASSEDIRRTATFAKAK